MWFSWQRIHLQCRRPGFDPWVGMISWRREQLPTPVFWPGEFPGLYSPWGRKESHKRTTFTFTFQCVDLASSWAITYGGFVYHVFSPFTCSLWDKCDPYFTEEEKKVQRKYFPKIRKPAWAELGFECRFHCLALRAMAPHSSPLAWQIPWMEEPGGLRSMVSLRVLEWGAIAFSETTYLGVLFLYPFSQSLSFGWGIQPIYV